MKKILVLTALCLMAMIGHANNYREDGGKYRYEAQKIIEQTYNVDENPILEMVGKYSDFIITPWDQQKIDFKVKIIVKSNDEDKLKAKFNSIDVKFDQFGNKVTAETVFGDYKYRTFNGTMTIKYYVKVPRDVFMELETKYGDIKVETVAKNLEVDIKYGDLKADSLLADNSIDIKYGDININYAKNIELELDYGDAKVRNCDKIDAELRYSNIYITELNEGNIENKYSTVKIERAAKITFDDAAYSDLKVSNVTNKIIADMRYCDLKATITTLKPVVELEGQYTDMTLYIKEDASFDYNLKSSYSDIIFRGFFETKSIKGHGSYGNGERGRLDINTSYGDVKINKE